MNKVDLHSKYKPMLKNDGKYFIVTGGRGSGKSFGVTVCILLLTYEVGHKILYTRYTMTSAEKSIIPEFLEKIELMGVQDVFEVTKKTITNKLTGSSIMFSGIQTASGDQTANLKSINGLTTFVLDEGEELLDEEKFDKINLSIRKKGVHNRCIVIMNPATKAHFIYGKFFEARGVPEGSNTQKGNATYIHTTYHDNIDNLDEDFIAECEDMKRRNPDKYKHQILGGWLDRAEGVIFTDWEIGDFRTDSDSVFGQDYGFSNDPSTLIEGSICKKTKRIWLREHVYKKGMTSQELEHANRRYAKDSLIVCDNADPRLWQSLRATGLNMTPTLKFPDSINKGIAIMQDYHIIIDPKSVNLVKEFNNYAWKVKAAHGGKSVPIDLWNHGIDAARYLIQYVCGRSIERGKYILS